MMRYVAGRLVAKIGFRKLSDCQPWGRSPVHPLLSSIKISQLGYFLLGNVSHDSPLREANPGEAEEDQEEEEVEL